MKTHALFMSCAAGALALASSVAWAAAPSAGATEAGSGTTIGELVVTAERREENLQDTPIAVSAFSADALKNEKLEGGQDLLLQIPNTNFTRTNFGAYNFKIRGIGTDVIGAGATAGVSINENELPVVVNHFQDSDFFDVDRVEVVRGPQGTLYGRNATGGAVDVITTQPTSTFGGFASLEAGNYGTIKATGAVNIPLGDMFAVRLAGVRLVESGYGINTYLNQRVDGRDLGAARVTVSFKPSDRFSAYLLYEHFGEDDTRNRVGKQLCIKDPGPASIGGVPIAPAGGSVLTNYAAFLNQGCLPGSLYQNAAYGTPNSNATFLATGNLFGLNNGRDVFVNNDGSPQMQDHNLHNIQSVIQPLYTAQEDLVDLHVQYKLTDDLTLTSITGYNRNVGTTAEDYNRVIPNQPFTPVATGFAGPLPLFAFPGGVVHDPQTGTSNRFTTFDYRDTESKQYTEELRLTSSFTGPINFTAGGFYNEITSMPGSTNYYVESNALTGSAYLNNATGGSLLGGPVGVSGEYPPNGTGHNYYDSRSGGGYLKSYAVFGEVYYDITPQLKLTLGGRYTVDQLLNYSYPIEVLVAVPNGAPTLPNTSPNPFTPNGG
ncbi:MAG: TonB-dependent receptor, partial [Caulobacteraceae bacterium]|nr:TonB-dependent receptor [Caulobacteraceae bacterium]